MLDKEEAMILIYYSMGSREILGYIPLVFGRVVKYTYSYVKFMLYHYCVSLCYYTTCYYIIYIGNNFIICHSALGKIPKP